MSKVVCISNLVEDVKTPIILTIGKIYDIVLGEIPIQEDAYYDIVIFDDCRNLVKLSSSFFKTITLYRESQLNKILN